MQKRPFGDPAVHISKISTWPELVGGLEASKQGTPRKYCTEDYPYMVVTRGARTKQESEVPKQARRRGQNSQAQNASHTNTEPKINTNRKLRVRVEDNADQSQQTNRRSEKPTSEPSRTSEETRFGYGNMRNQKSMTYEGTTKHPITTFRVLPTFNIKQLWS